MRNKKLILFGKGLYTEIVHQYFQEDSCFEVVAFCLDDEFITEEKYLGLPMVKFSEITKKYSPSNHCMHIAISYTNLNKLREIKFKEAKEKGYELISYVSSNSTIKSKIPIGENSFIFEDNTIQPFVKIGNNVILWSGNHIGHHSVIKDHNFISSHVVISGQCEIKSNCFIGVNSTIAHRIIIEEENIIGAGSVITKNTSKKEVYAPPKTNLISSDSSRIAKFL